MLLPFVYCILPQIKQQQLKNSARQRLEEHLINRITLSSAQFQWTDLGREISINGSLFDVKSYSSKNGQFTFTGLFDKEETTLVNKLKDNWTNHEKEDKTLALLFQVLQCVYHASASGETFDHALLSQYHAMAADKVCLIPAEILTPPPQG
jgi:hypothetical protein